MLRDRHTRPYLGYGLGLRPDHYEEIIRDWPAVGWFEILTENYMVDGGKPLHYLERVRSRYPVVMHGVSLSIGSCDPAATQGACRAHPTAVDFGPFVLDRNGRQEPARSLAPPLHRGDAYACG